MYEESIIDVLINFDDLLLLIIVYNQLICDFIIITILANRSLFDS